MGEIRKGFEDNLTIEQVKLFAKPEFNSNQMLEIRRGFQDGLTMEQVKVYTSPEFDWKQIKKIREFIKENNITDISTKTIKFLISIDCI